MKRKTSAWPEGLAWDCKNVRDFVLDETEPLGPVAWAMLDAHLDSCSDCRALVDSRARSEAPEWVRPWLAGEIGFAELLRRRKARGPAPPTWWHKVMSSVAFPVAFRHPTLAFFKVGDMPMAFADSDIREVVANLSQGQRVVLRIKADGLCDLSNEVRAHPRVGVVLVDASTHQVVPLGVRGSATETVVIVQSGAGQAVWFDPTGVCIGSLCLGVFVSEE